jgi:hypothetical protein
MSLRKVLSLVLSSTALAGVLAVSAQDAPAPAPAQQPASVEAAAIPDGGVPRYIRPETPEERKQRLGTVEDPGLDPDPETVWWRFGKAYKIDKALKKWAKYVNQPGWVRPIGQLNLTAEIYQENDKYVWVWLEEIEPLPSREELQRLEREAKFPKLSEEDLKYYRWLRDEFTPLDPPKSDVHVKFEPASTGLPTAGSWRNSLAVADMNEDGFADLVLPPQRGPANAPTIMLGDGNGKWKQWAIQWPRAFNYGSVVAADFNKDKHMDLAFGIHLTGVAVFLGNGKGGFREAEAGLSSVFASRRVVTADVDRDGWLDVVAMSEGPSFRGDNPDTVDLGGLRAYLNRNKGESWEAMGIAQPKESVGGDWLAVGNFNGDRYPDFVGGSLYFNGVHTMWRSQGAKKYEVVDSKRTVIPFHSYYHAATAGRFSSTSLDDAIVSYHRIWPQVSPSIVAKPPLEAAVGIDRVTFANGEAKRFPVIRWGASPPIWGLGAADFDGDNRQDIVYTRHDPREAVLLLGDGSGHFKRAALEGVTLPNLRNYDLSVADLNGDAKPDLILMYEAEGGTAFSPKNGRVEVFLNRGASRKVAETK